MGNFLLRFLRTGSVLLILLGFAAVNALSAYAIDLGVATYVDIADAQSQSVEDGSLIVSTLEGLYLSRYPYDPALIGVVSVNSAIVLGAKNEGNLPLISKGNIAVRVSTINGAILKGDPITSSNIPGVAMKATRAGTVIGTALEDYSEPDENKVGKILVLINIQYNQNGNKNADTSTITLGIILRSAMATLIAVVTTVIGFIFFGRFAAKGMESLGRNPMASKTIKLGMILQGTLFITLIAVGYVLAYLLVR